MRRSSNSDGTVVLGVHIVGERLRLEASSLVTPSSSQKVEGSVHLLEVSASGLVFDQRDPDHLQLRGGVIVVSG